MKITESIHPGEILVEESLKPTTLDISDLTSALHRPGMKAVSDDELKAALRKRFDYTTWRKKNVVEDDIAAVSKAAMKLRKKTAQKS